jgi:dTDP-4-dehydrorhamnose reductase
VLVLGGGGQVARAVVRSAPARCSVLVKSRAELDITDEAAVTAVLRDSAAQWVVNAAAYTAVDRAESEPDAARAVNDTAVDKLVRAAAGGGSRLLHLSTDFVFDGRSNRAYLPGDATHPLSVYGTTKRDGERHLEGSDGIVLRTAWVYAASGRNFALTMLRLMREKDEVRVVADQIGTPTSASSIARAIWALLDSGAPAGVYHWTDLGVASWYDFAVAIQDGALERGLLSRAVPVVPIGTAAYPTPARRPTFSVLDCAATCAAASLGGRHWRHNLELMLDELRAQ